MTPHNSPNGASLLETAHAHDLTQHGFDGVNGSMADQGVIIEPAMTTEKVRYILLFGFALKLVNPLAYMCQVNQKSFDSYRLANKCSDRSPNAAFHPFPGARRYPTYLETVVKAVSRVKIIP